MFVSIANRDKRAAIFPVKRLSDLGFRVLATAGTAQVLRRNGVESRSSASSATDRATSSSGSSPARSTSS